MGINDRAQNRKDDKLAAKRLKQRIRDRAGLGHAVADWESCDGSLLTKFVATVSRDGGAIRLGYTRDGGAYAVGVYGDGDPYTVYVTPSEDLNDWLREQTQNFADG